MEMEVVSNAAQIVNHVPIIQKTVQVATTDNILLLKMFQDSDIWCTARWIKVVSLRIVQYVQTCQLKFAINACTDSIISKESVLNAHSLVAGVTTLSNKFTCMTLFLLSKN